MQHNFDKFDIQKKGYLTYEEYKLLALSNLKKPLPIQKMGDTVFQQDVIFCENMHTEDDYSELFELFSEGGYITYGSLYTIMQKTGFDCNENEILNMIDAVTDKKMIDYEKFCKLLQFFSK
ncbi:hypothetical protein BDAP_000344 [Binucleata daphniae]